MEKEVKKLYLDVETTGPYYWVHGIHQLSGEIWVDKERTFFDYHVKPFGEDVVNDKALEVSHKTIEQLRASPSAREVWSELYGVLTSYVNPFDSKDKFFVYAYNAAFDENFLRQWCLKLGFEFFGALFHSPINCVMQKAFIVLGADRTDLENVKLVSIAKHFGLEIDEERLHDALYDVEVMRRLDTILDKKLAKGLMQ